MYTVTGFPKHPPLEKIKWNITPMRNSGTHVLFFWARAFLACWIFCPLYWSCLLETPLLLWSPLFCACCSWVYMSPSSITFLKAEILYLCFFQCWCFRMFRFGNSFTISRCSVLIVRSVSFCFLSSPCIFRLVFLFAFFWLLTNICFHSPKHAFWTPLLNYGGGGVNSYE